MKLSKHFSNGRFLKASDFEEPKLLTITNVTIEKVGKDKEKKKKGKEKPSVHFKETEKLLALNVTNHDTIVNISGDDDTENWVGTQIVAFKTETDFKGERVDCIRLRAPKKKTKVQKKAESVDDDELADIPF